MQTQLNEREQHMKKIEKLTPEQEAQLPVYRDMWISIGLSTERVDRTEATQAVRLLYECGGLPPPNHIECAGGPRKAKEILRRHGCDDSVTASCVFGSHEAGWLSFYEYFQEECDIDFDNKIGKVILDPALFTSSITSNIPR